MMGISFFETMQGLAHFEDGPRPLRFQIKAESTHIGAFLLGGEVKITGTVSAPPLVDTAPIEGHMEVMPLRRRRITYDFSFRDDEDTPCRLSGQKTISLRRPIASMTDLEATLYRDGEAVADAELHFDLADLLDFLRSWSPSSTIPQKDLHAPVGKNPAATHQLSDKERQVLEALAHATIVEGRNVPACDERTIDEAATQIQSSPSHVFTFYRVGLRLLDAMSRPFAMGKAFTSLSLEKRRQLLDDWSQQDGPLSSTMALLVQMLTIMIKVAHFGRQDYLEAIGHPEPQAAADEPDERYMRRVIPPEYLMEETDLRAHAVVVGTGAGGAAVAYQLASRGLAVAMVEEGRYRRRSDFSGPPMDRVHAMYRHRATNFSVGTPVVIPQGRAVGGTTTINSGTCFATPDAVLQQWRDQGFPQDFEPQHYHDYSKQVARMLQVEPGDPEALGQIADVIADGAEALGFEHGALPRNAPGCTGAGQCILGCPEGAKRSTDRSYVPAALRAGAELYTGLPATRILMDRDRAVGIETRGADRHGRPRRTRIMADRVIIACGAIHSPLFLRDNGVSHPQLGQNLSLHPALGMLARMDRSLDPWKTIPQGYTFHALEEQEIRYEGYYLHPQLTSPMMPWNGAELTRWMDDFDKIAQFGFMVRDKSVGSVRRTPTGQPLVNYTLQPRSIERIKQGASLLAQLFLEAGAREVFPGFGPPQIIKDHDQARALRHLQVGPLDFRLLGAHPLGTCRVGANAATSVLDFDHQVRGTQNLHVVDGSAVPSSLGVNPQMTIMAMALRAGDLIADQLGA